jgi:hypothetical protein
MNGPSSRPGCLRRAWCVLGSRAWQSGGVDGNAADGGRDFFVSYTQADRAWAEWIAWQLEDEGYRVLIQAWDMPPGVNWTDLMQQGVQGAARTVAVLSASYLESVFCTAEWQAAWRADPLGEQRKLVVLRIADCDRPGLLAGVVSADLFGLGEAAAREVVRSAARGAVTGRAKPPGAPGFPAGTRAGVRFPGTLPRVWNVPPRNPHFTGRAADLASLRAQLGGQRAVTVHAVHGMGGVGKTQTVIEYAYRHAACYDVVWWVNAERAAVVGGQFTALGQELGLPALTGDDAVAAVGRELRGRDRWLLIFDNAEDPAQIRSLLPGGAGDVLITTRRGGFRSLGTVLDLDVHPGVAADLNDVGQALSDLSRPAEALPLQERALRIDEAAYGPDHPDVATDLNYVGRALSALDRSAEALPLHQRALRIHEAAHGPDHPGVATNLNHVGRALSALGRPAEALPLHQRALRIREAAYGPDHKATRESRQLVEQLKSSPRG